MQHEDISEKISKMVELLNEDLRHEFRHLHFYLHSGVMVRTLWRHEISEYLLEEAASELKHCEEFARKIVWLGGTPETEALSFPTGLVQPRDILEYALTMEQEVVDRYAKRLEQTESFDPILKDLHLFYEDQLQDSNKTVMDIKEMLR